MIRKPKRPKAARLLSFLTVVFALGACSSGVASPSPAAALPTASPVVTAKASQSATPSPTAAIVKITPVPGAPDSKTVVQLVAANSKWAPNGLTAPAAKIWHVKIDNQDNKNNDFTGFGHNFTVASGPSFPERIFQTPKFGYGSQTFDVPALPAGSYLFICTLHENVMTGTLTIK